MKELLDLIPLAAFALGAFKFGVVQGAAAMLVATIVVFIIHFFRQGKRLDKQQWVVLTLTIVFCGFTVIFNDDYYVKMKSPVINGLFAIVLVGSVLVKKPLMKMAMQKVFSLTDSGWQKLTLAWAGFFALMGSIHYYTAFHLSEEIWISFKLWGWIPFMLVFMGLQFSFLKNHLNPEMLEQAKQAQDNKNS